ncbi:MAG: ATP-binding protein [Rhodospirillaceae bacterium]
MLSKLRLPAINAVWQEIAARALRRFERHLEEAHLPPGKTLATFDFTAVPMVSKAQVMALAAGDNWLEKGANLILFGPPGGGKSHLSAALGLALIENGWRVMFARTTDLVQKLQIARSELQLERLHLDNGQPTFRRVGKNLPRSSNQKLMLIVVPRQSLSHRDRELSFRLSRTSHLDCRATQ